MGGWYNDFRIPFRKSFRATIKSHVATKRTRNPKCSFVPNMDCWGNDLYQNTSVGSAGACCSICMADPQCGAYTYHPSGMCFIKSKCGQMQPSAGNSTGAIEAWLSFQGMDMPGAPTFRRVTTASSDDCEALCQNTSQCAAFTFHGRNNLCELKNSTQGGQVPSSTSVVSGCLNCTSPIGVDDSVFVLVRGIYNISSLSVNVAGVPVPANARMVTQENYGLLQPLDYYDLVNVTGVNEGLVLMTTLSVLSGDANFMVRLSRQDGTWRKEK